MFGVGMPKERGYFCALRSLRRPGSHADAPKEEFRLVHTRFTGQKQNRMLNRASGLHSLRVNGLSCICIHRQMHHFVFLPFSPLPNRLIRWCEYHLLWVDQQFSARPLPAVNTRSECTRHIVVHRVRDFTYIRVTSVAVVVVHGGAWWWCRDQFELYIWVVPLGVRRMKPGTAVAFTHFSICAVFLSFFAVSLLPSSPHLMRAHRKCRGTFYSSALRAYVCLQAKTALLMLPARHTALCRVCPYFRVRRGILV